MIVGSLDGGGVIVGDGGDPLGDVGIASEMWSGFDPWCRLEFIGERTLFMWGGLVLEHSLIP